MNYSSPSQTRRTVFGNTETLVRSGALDVIVVDSVAALVQEQN